MIEIAIVHEVFGKVEYRSSTTAPRKGDRIDIWCTPPPVVRDVIWWPSTKTIQGAGLDNTVDVLVFVD
jgi:hypothetical protein